jgi:Zinc carboxypeptidase
MYLSLQAFGEQITIPYNHFPAGTQNQAQLLTLGNQVAAAIRNSPAQRSYTVGVGGVLNGLERGTPIDFAYELRRIKWSFAMRLPRGGATGWDIPENQLLATLSESFSGFLVFARHVVSS